MTFSVGQFGRDLTVQNPSRFVRSGHEVTIEGWAIGATQEQFQALLQQCEGLKNDPDVPVVPVVYTRDIAFQGFYRIDNVSIELDPNYEKTYKFRYTMQGELISGGSSYPEIELVATGAARTGKPAGVTQQYWTVIPDQALMWSIYDGSITGAYATRAYDTTPHNMQYMQGNSLVTYAPVFSLSPSTFYTGACYLKEGTNRYLTQGREILNYPSAWSAGNELLTIGPPSNSAYAFNMQFRKANGAAPSVTNYDVEIGYVTAGPVWNNQNLSSPRMITCLRNSPECVIIRLSWDQTSLQPAYRWQLDITLRRGARGVALKWDTNAAPASYTWGFAWRPSATFTTFDANSRGIVESSADADGNKRVLISRDAATLGTAAGRVYAGAATTFNGFAGISVDESANGEKSSHLQDQYYAAMQERQRVVPK